MAVKTLEVETSGRVQLVDITDRVRVLAAGSGIKEGVAHIFVPHTTAAITINENADPTVAGDMTTALERLVPRGGAISMPRATPTPTSRPRCWAARPRC